MNPQDTNDQQNKKSLLPQKTVSLNPVSNEEWEKNKTTRDATTNVLRSQINNIIDGQATNTTQPENSNPYFRNHEEHVKPEIEKWREYHSAWQNYYQKYYENYYSSHMRNVQKQLEEKYQDQIIRKIPSKDEEVFDLKQKLIGRVKESARSVKKSRHFWPIISGILAVIIFLFLQFNQIIVSNVLAYISPGNIDAQNIIIDPASEISVGPESRLIIPKINIDVPVSYDIGNDYDSQMAAMDYGVAHFSIPGASAHPGETGNTVIAGHSSSSFFDNGKYKFIFVQLDKLEAGDLIYANYNSIRYTYVITKKEIVKPTNIDKLVYETNTPVITLVTCTPIGTAIDRLLVTAEQISPNPQKAIASTKDDTNQDSASMPGDPPTLLERLFGLGD